MRSYTPLRQINHQKRFRKIVCLPIFPQLLIHYINKSCMEEIYCYNCVIPYIASSATFNEIILDLKALQWSSATNHSEGGRSDVTWPSCCDWWRGRRVCCPYRRQDNVADVINRPLTRLPFLSLAVIGSRAVNMRSVVYLMLTIVPEKPTPGVREIIGFYTSKNLNLRSDVLWLRKVQGRTTCLG